VNVDLVRSLGATSVIDYTKEEFTKAGKEYDVVFDAVGKRKSTAAMARAAAVLSAGESACPSTIRFPEQPEKT
jgi:NADPH:quinone reductase-like Zn-dependent oxidoreductase